MENIYSINNIHLVSAKIIPRFRSIRQLQPVRRTGFPDRATRLLLLPSSSSHIWYSSSGGSKTAIFNSIIIVVATAAAATVTTGEIERKPPADSHVNAFNLADEVFVTTGAREGKAE